MKKTTFAISAVAVIALAVASSFGVAQALHPEHNRFHAAWKDTYVEPAAMMRGVDAIVIARHVGTSPGRIAYSDNPEDAVPFELNHFVVERGLKGLPAGTAFTLERVGGDLDGMTVYLDADGGAYRKGEAYALFLNRQPESGFFYLVNDEGRFSVERDQLTPVSHGAVAGQLAGLNVEELAANVRQAVRRGAPLK